MWSKIQFLLLVWFTPIRFSYTQSMSFVVTYLFGLPITHAPDFDVTVPNVACSPVLVDVCVASDPPCVAEDSVLDEEAIDGCAVLDEDAGDCSVFEDESVFEEEAVEEVCVSPVPPDVAVSDEDVVEVDGLVSPLSPEAAEVAVSDDEAVDEGWPWSPVPLDVDGAVVVVGAVEVSVDGSSSSDPLHSRL